MTNMQTSRCLPAARDRPRLMLRAWDSPPGFSRYAQKWDIEHDQLYGLHAHGPVRQMMLNAPHDSIQRNGRCRGALVGGSPIDRARHLALTAAITPWIRLLHVPVFDSPRRRPMPVISI